MKLEVIKIAEVNEVVLEAKVKKVNGNLHQLHLEEEGESVWIETPYGEVRVALYDKVNVSFFFVKGAEIDFNPGKAKILLEPK